MQCHGNSTRNNDTLCRDSIAAKNRKVSERANFTPRKSPHLNTEKETSSSNECGSNRRLEFD